MSSIFKVLSIVLFTIAVLAIVYLIHEQGQKFIYNSFSGEIKQMITSKVKVFNNSAYKDSLSFYINNKSKEIEEKMNKGAKITFKEKGDDRFFDAIDRAANDKELSADEYKQLIVLIEEAVEYE